MISSHPTQLPGSTSRPRIRMYASKEDELLTSCLRCSSLLSLSISAWLTKISKKLALRLRFVTGAASDGSGSVVMARNVTRE